MSQASRLGPSEESIETMYQFLRSVVFDGHRAAVTLPIRTGEGIRGVGLHGLFAVAVTLGWAGFYPCPPLIYYTAFLMVLLIVKRFGSLCRHHFGVRQLSHYPGYPALVLLVVPFASEGFAKAILEPLLIAGVGLVVRDHNRGIGMFLLTGAAFAAYRGLMDVAMTAAGDLAETDAREMARQRAARKQRKGWMN